MFSEGKAILAPAALICALAGGCLDVDGGQEARKSGEDRGSPPTEALQETNELDAIDGEFIGVIDTEIADPAHDERRADIREMAYVRNPIPREVLSLQGDKGESYKGDPGTDDLIETSANLNPSWSFNWYQGWGAVPMGSTSDRFCFLTAVQGHFEGGGESVHVYISGGSWWLAGTSQQSGVKASALCIPRAYYGQTLNFTGEYYWSQGNYPIYMGSDTNRVCFLTAVQGQFKGGGEQVEAYRSGGVWWLGGTGYQSGVLAGARCVNTIYRNGPYYWSQGQSSVIMSDANYWACGLTRMSGDFEGGGESVVAFVSGSWWYLGGSSYQSGVSTAAYCL